MGTSGKDDDTVGCSGVKEDWNDDGELNDFITSTLYHDNYSSRFKSSSSFILDMTSFDLDFDLDSFQLS